jgi:hypothetical protein
VIWVGRESEYFFDDDWTGSISLIPLDNSASSRMPVNAAECAQGTRPDKIRDKRRRPGDSESFNQLVRIMPFEPKGVS